MDKDQQQQKPFNDAVNHLTNIEGYPINNPMKVKGIPAFIRILGYSLIGFIVLGFIVTLILYWIQ